MPLQLNDLDTWWLSPKTKSIAVLLAPSSLDLLGCYLGMLNFYHRFQLEITKVLFPLTAISVGKHKPKNQRFCKDRTNISRYCSTCTSTTQRTSPTPIWYLEPQRSCHSSSACRWYNSAVWFLDFEAVLNFSKPFQYVVNGRHLTIFTNHQSLSFKSLSFSVTKKYDN